MFTFQIVSILITRLKDQLKNLMHHLFHLKQDFLQINLKFISIYSSAYPALTQTYLKHIQTHSEFFQNDVMMMFQT